MGEGLSMGKSDRDPENFISFPGLGGFVKGNGLLALGWLVEGMVGRFGAAWGV